MKNKEVCILIAFILLILFINFISSKNITINYPSEVKINQEFEAELELIDFEEKVYDVKIDILNNKEERIAQIYNGGDWKSTYYYIKGAINTAEKTKEKFKLKVAENYNGEANIIIKIKSGTTYTFEGYKIKITGKEESEEEEKNEDDNEEEEESENDEKEDNSLENQKNTEENIRKQENIEIETINSQQEIKDAGIINLSPSKISADKIEKEIIYKSKNEYIKEYSMYGFSILCIVLIILLLKSKEK